MAHKDRLNPAISRDLLVEPAPTGGGTQLTGKASGGPSRVLMTIFICYSELPLASLTGLVGKIKVVVSGSLMADRVGRDRHWRWLRWLAAPSYFFPSTKP